MNYKDGKGERTVSPKALKMSTENINLRNRTIFTSFDQNTAEIYDNHILLSMNCIFWPEFGLKPRYVALHVTETEEKFFYNIVPPFHTRSFSQCWLHVRI